MLRMTLACAAGPVISAISVVVLPVTASAALVLSATIAAAASSLIKVRMYSPCLLMLTQARRTAKGLSRAGPLVFSAFRDLVPRLVLHVGGSFGEPPCVGADRHHVPAGRDKRLRIVHVIGKN